MEPQRWKEIDRIFATALELHSAERTAYVAEACGTDEDLRSEVESLLAHVVPDGLEEGQAPEEATRVLLVETPEPKMTRIGRYQIIRSLGAGGMGRVYLGLDEQLNRPVAVKLLSHYNASEEERMRRFRQEALAASALNHPNILTVHEIGEFEGAHFITTEFIDGLTLQARMNAEPVPLDLAVDVTIQTAGALAAAHAAGIIHRDIKPENIMVRADGLVKVLDFGIAKYAQPDGAAPLNENLIKTTPGAVVGTVAYMSPEQARGQQTDARTDIWSLGVVLYEMVSGQRPFSGQTGADVMSAVLGTEPPRLTDFDAALPETLDWIVFKALKKEKEARYQTAPELLADLKELRKKLEAAAEQERPKPQGNSSGLRTGGRGTTTLASPDSALTRRMSSRERVGGSLRRYKLAILLSLALIGALALSLYLYTPKPEAAIDSIAVLPFENNGGDPDTEYLSDGLTESLIYRLSQLPNLKVSPRSSVFQYKGKETDPIKVGSDLNVSTVLSGRIVQRGDNLTISAELTDVRSNKQLWGERYERNLSELLATQREIAQEIVEKMKLKLSGEERGLTKHYTDSSEAYQLYLKGRFYWNKRTSEALQTSIGFFNKAIEKDPNFALAYAGLADSYVVPANHRPPQETMPKAKAAALRALELDETLAEAHTSLGRVLATYEWNWPGAEKEFKRAIELNPRYAVAHQWYGGWLQAMGLHGEAIAERKKAQELDPLSLVINFEWGLSFYFARDYDQAIKQFQATLELDQNFRPAQAHLAAAYEQKGMYDEAIAGFKEVIALKGGTGGNEISLPGLGHVYAVSGKKTEAHRVLDELKQRSAHEYIPATSFAFVYAGLGEKNQAFAALEQGYQDHLFQMQWLKVEPRWDSLRSDPRFAELIHRMGLQQ